jgi:hypothetical protein
MKYVTQGTIQVQVNLDDGQYCVVINPVPEYTATHRGKKYMVLMSAEVAQEFDPRAGKPEEARVCLISKMERYPIKVPRKAHNPGVLDILKAAALQRSKVELELAANGSDQLELVRIEVPAPLEPDPASRG